MQARALGSGSALHSEHGFFKCTSGTEVDAVIAHATGHVEVSSGSIGVASVEFASTSIGSWRDADPVVSLRRHLSVVGDLLRDRLEMEAMAEHLQAHVAAELGRA
jgi:THAP4-like, heme-binding beta-barrel domain